MAVAIEEQRIAGSPCHRPVIEPGLCIRDSPERDTREGAAMLEEDAEESGIAIGQLLLDGIGQALDVRIQLRVLADAKRHIGRGPVPHGGQHVYIEFGDGDLDAQSLQGGDGGVLLLRGGRIQAEMGLNADGVNGDFLPEAS